jgi:tRNA dimethylallyltransferase
MPESRAQLHHQIEVRFDDMLDRGLVAEVEQLRAKYALHDALPAMKAVGYRQAWQFLEGDLGFDVMREKAIIATRQLAKRQFTWLRSFETVKKISTASLDALLKIEPVANILIKAS